MTNDSLEARVYAHVRKHDGFYLFGKPELTEQTDLDFDLQLDDDEALALMEDFFTTFNVARGNFSITTYYPPDPPLSVMFNPFRNARSPLCRFLPSACLLNRPGLAAGFMTDDAFSQFLFHDDHHDGKSRRAQRTYDQ